ncbi:hypothetical protein [Flavobacterium cerinum]|uniref:Uncharacterized protein n=1 Tax=Flavobacterium cerinum TaxID=2502784 RepID=A0A3S3QE28_9FLAO|nr:hypothetical protein [Flavobacterium cerinum]RWX01667.1 hypothetical protein EPI11_06880 [Flavobacterium cerinum]
MKILSFQFNIRLFVFLLIGFVLCTIVGTVSHEGGHWAVSKYFGNTPKIHYASTSLGFEAKATEFETFYEKNKSKILSREESPEKEKFREINKNVGREKFLITLGGPIQTMITGTIGFLILWFNRKKIYRKYNLTFSIWASIFITFFWSRQILNFIGSLDTLFETERRAYRSDEPKLSQYLELPHWVFGLITCILGLLLLSWVFFKIIPIRQRLTFLLAGLTGSALGLYLWMDKLGPVILP